MYNQAWHAAKGEQGYRHRHLHNRTMERAAVNIYKTDNSYEMLVFAPGRIKENFNLQLKGNELVISYYPPEGFPQVNWVSREYSRGGFERSFVLDESVDKANIAAKYVDGVLQVSLPVIQGETPVKHEITVN